MKTYTLSVKTLTRNLTPERHNNCAPCLGLILPIRWVTPPPNFLEVFSFGVTIALSSYLVCLQHWFIFMVYRHNVDLVFIDIYIYIYIYIYIHICVLSSTAFTYSYVFKLTIF